MDPIRFEIEKEVEGELGRAGVLTTMHGKIMTPAFVAVGTKATVKSLTPEQVKETGVQVVLGNTYHLYLQPGEKLIQDHGGLGAYMGWHGPTMTDSGGFQVFSLGAAYGKEISKVTTVTDPHFLIPERSGGDTTPLAKIGADGVSFKSHLDGSLHYITPEKSIEIQHAIGADIIFAFDECTSPQETFRYQEEALLRTHRWAERSLRYHKQSPHARTQALFGIIQGGREKELREKSALAISHMRTEEGEGFDGFGIGGSFAKEDMSSAVTWVNALLPKDKPRHLLGIGEPEDLCMGVLSGVDLFDCVAPTRNARNGTLYTKDGKINMLNAQYVHDQSSIEKDCTCYTCAHFTKSYVSHLYRSKEILAGTLGTIHNLHFISHHVQSMRDAILRGDLKEYIHSFLSRYTK